MLERFKAVQAPAHSRNSVKNKKKKTGLVRERDDPVDARADPIENSPFDTSESFRAPHIRPPLTDLPHSPAHAR